MLAKRIIPCLDVTGGRVVKGVNFVELRDAGDPVAVSRRYDEQGADEGVVPAHLFGDVGADEGSAAAGEAGRADGRPGLAGEAADQAWR